MTDEKSRAMDEIQRLGQEFDADDLRAKSDRLLELCGLERSDQSGLWILPDGRAFLPSFHPQANAQDAIALAEAKGLRVMRTSRSLAAEAYSAELWNDNPSVFKGAGPTIAQAICAAIDEAVK